MQQMDSVNRHDRGAAKWQHWSWFSLLRDNITEVSELLWREIIHEPRPPLMASAPESRRLRLPLDKHTRIADITVMTMFSLHTRFLLNAGNTLNRR